MTTAVQKFSYGNDQRDFRDSRDMDAATPQGPGDKDCNPVNKNSCNLCTLIPGKTSHFIVAGAHLDTVRNSPGANDNGSSVVALLEAIRIFKQAKLELNNPILFCFWGSEERSSDGENMSIGFGSRFFLHNNGYKKVIRTLARKNSCQELTGEPQLQCYLNLEMTGTKDRELRQAVMIGDPLKHLSSPSGTLQLTELYAEFLGSRDIDYFRAEPQPDFLDTGSFYFHNIPALTITAGPERLKPGCYHRWCDKIDEIDFDVLSNITQTVIYALTKLSLGEGVRTTDT